MPRCLENEQVQIEPQAANRHPKSVSLLLRTEGLAVALAAIAVYWLLGGPWWLFLLLILVPDLAAVGYFAGPAAGAATYNSVHNYALPLVIGAIAYFGGAPFLLPFVAIWIAHIGGDRALGYGLKYPAAFQQTHLGPIGKARNG